MDSKTEVLEPQSNVMVGAYLAKGTIGNVGMAGAPIVHFSLVVVPSQHKVAGMVHVTQAILNGSYTGYVTGTIYSTGLGKVTQVVGMQGTIRCDTDLQKEIPFEANMAIDNSWDGVGSFTFINGRIDDVPVKASK